MYINSELKQIVDVVRGDIPVETLLGPSRKPPLPHKRAVIAYLIHREAPVKVKRKSIAEMLGLDDVKYISKLITSVHELRAFSTEVDQELKNYEQRLVRDSVKQLG